MAETLLLSLTVAGCFLFTMGVLAAAAAHALGVAIARAIAPFLAQVLAVVPQMRILRAETNVT